MVLENIFLGSVGWTGFDFLLWKIWPRFCRHLFESVVVTFPSYSTVQMSWAECSSPSLPFQPTARPVLGHHCSLCSGCCPSCIRGRGSKLCLGIFQHGRQLLPGWVLSSRLLHSYFWSSFCYFIHYSWCGPSAALCFICIYLVNEVPFALSEFL